MRAPLVVAALVAVVGVAFVLYYEPSPAEDREHDWLAVIAMAATSGLFYAAGTGPRRRILMLGVAYALFVATTMAWFVGSAAFWPAVFAAIAAAIEAERRIRRSAAPR